jgi:Ca-activated chloride channel family protein
VALARPQRITRGKLPPAQGIDILLTIDTSLSMAATDFSPNRLGAARSAALEFVSRRKNDRIGVVVFGGTAMLACPLTLDYAAVTEFIEAIDFNMTRVDGTAIGDAIVTSVNHIKDSKAKSKVVILLTDGRSNSGMITDPAAGARAAAAYGIKVYTIGTAGRGPAQIPTGDPAMPVVTIDEDLDEPTLLEIARLTGGEFFRARNLMELQRVYSQIDAMEKTEFQARSLSSYHDAHMPLLAAGALLLALCFVLEKTWLRRLP